MVSQLARVYFQHVIIDSIFLQRSLDVVGLYHRCCRRRPRVVQQQRRARRDGRRTRLPGAAAHEPHRCKALPGNKTKHNNYEFCEIKICS
jgi:hypothetical protein